MSRSSILQEYTEWMPIGLCQSSESHIGKSDFHVVTLVTTNLIATDLTSAQ